MQFDDHSKKDEIVILVFGDSGSGSNDQRAVGLRMAEVCETAQCDLALMLGDNFYNRGVRRPENGVWDETFERKFEEPYRDVGQVQFWAVAGNHDWYRGRESVDTEVAYSLHSERWRMPAYDYAIPGLPEWLQIYAIDTTVLDKGVRIGQLERAEAQLCRAPGWRILMGHHAVYSSGQHGGADGVMSSMAAALRPLIRDCGVQVYLSGHDHHQEHLTAQRFEQIIQGAAGKLRAVATRAARNTAEQRFAAEQYGFAIVAFTRDTVAMTFYGYPPGSPERFGVIYDVTLERAAIDRRPTPDAGRRTPDAGTSSADAPARLTAQPCRRHPRRYSAFLEYRPSMRMRKFAGGSIASSSSTDSTQVVTLTR